MGNENGRCKEMTFELALNVGMEGGPSISFMLMEGVSSIPSRPKDNDFRVSALCIAVGNV